MKLWSLFLSGCVALGLAGMASAGTITGLYNTGVDASGNPLPDGTVPDPHYTITASDDGDPLGAVQVRTSTGGFPIPPWLGDSSTSAWITPNKDHNGDGGVGTDAYTTTFTLPSNVKSVTITGNWATDNEGSDILINGNSTGNTASGFGSYTPFSLTSSAVTPGTNTLTFLVHNDGGPAGLRVDGISGTYTTASAVPEPASLTLLGLGGLGLVLARRRKLA